KWYDSEIYGSSTTYMSVKSTMYSDKLGNAAQSVAVTNIKAAGTYTVTMTLKSGYQWDDKSTGDKSFNIVIDKSAPNVSADFVDTNVKKGIYATYNNCTLPELKNTAANATPGTFAWKSGQQPTGPNGFKTTPYEWEFTPDANNINNYDTATGTISINYRTQSVSSLEIIVDDGAQFYDAFTLTDSTYSIKNYITVNGVYQDGITKELVQPEDYTLSLPQAASLTAGTVKIRAKRTSDNKTGDKDITVIASQVLELEAEYDDGGTHLTYSENLTTEDLKDNLTVTAKWNYSGFDFLDVDNADVTITGNLAAGPLTMTATYGGQSSNFYPVIDKGTLDINSVKLNGLEHTYDGTAQKILATGDVKDSVSKQAMSGINFVYTYTKGGTEVAGAAANGVADAGTYTVTLSFTHSNPNYEAITVTKTATLAIEKASFDVSAIKLEVVSPVTYDGVERTIAISGGEVPEGVTVNYEYDGTTQSTPFTFVNAGTYTVNVSFTHNNDNYNLITKTLSATLTINKADYPGADGITFENKSASLGVTLSAVALNVPDGVTVTYVYGGKEQSAPFEFTELNESGYVVTAKFAHTNPNYNAIADKTATIVISKKPVYDESGLSFVATSATGNGTQFTATYNTAATIDIVLTGSVIDKGGASVAVTVEYIYKKKVGGSWEVVTKADLCNAGEYEITASISTGDDTYAAVSDRVVTLTVAKADFVISVEFDGGTVVYDGEPHGIAISGTLPDGVEAVYSVKDQSTTQFA
ncbi:MAG: hypothetical protein K2G26_01150, partial [Clostridia bacterium]|nr:hypothetical protein [Clostridia bacterium]